MDLLIILVLDVGTDRFLNHWFTTLEVGVELQHLQQTDKQISYFINFELGI